jgi:hypothetical protein
MENNLCGMLSFQGRCIGKRGIFKIRIWAKIFKETAEKLFRIFAQIVQWRNASMVRMMSGVRFSLWAQEFVIFNFL